MTVGLGTGSTVAHLLPALARRGVGEIRCVATSVATEQQARELGIPVEEFDRLQRLDIAIDGTDEVTPDGWLIKGGGAPTCARRSSPPRPTASSSSPTPASRSMPCAVRSRWSSSPSASPRPWPGSAPR